jgi:hypothetical protein
MKHAPIIAAEFMSHPPRAKRGIFALLVEALYHSRRVRAERTLRRYRDVVGRAQLGILRELNVRSENCEHIRE